MWEIIGLAFSAIGTFAFFSLGIVAVYFWLILKDTI